MGKTNWDIKSVREEDPVTSLTWNGRNKGKEGNQETDSARDDTRRLAGERWEEGRVAQVVGTQRALVGGHLGGAVR